MGKKKRNKIQNVNLFLSSYLRSVKGKIEKRKYSHKSKEELYEKARRSMLTYGNQSPNWRKGCILKHEKFKDLDKLISFSELIKQDLDEQSCKLFKQALDEKAKELQMSNKFKNKNPKNNSRFKQRNWEEFKKMVPLGFDEWDFNHRKLWLSLNGHYGYTIERLRRFNGTEEEKQKFLQTRRDKFRVVVWDHLNKRDKDFLMSTDKFIQFKELTGFVPE